MSDANFEAEARAWQWIKDHMPSEARRALLHFTSLNQSYNGAEWWDVLSILRDSDSHLDIIEPMVEAMDEWDVLRSFVTLTLIYADMMFATDYTTNMRVTTVRSTIDGNNGMIR
jgi:hypothetical protein